MSVQVIGPGVKPLPWIVEPDRTDAPELWRNAALIVADRGIDLVSEQRGVVVNASLPTLGYETRYGRADSYEDASDQGLKWSGKSTLSAARDITLFAFFRHRTSGRNKLINTSAGTNAGLSLQIGTTDRLGLTIGGVAENDGSNCVAIVGNWIFAAVSQQASTGNIIMALRNFDNGALVSDLLTARSTSWVAGDGNFSVGAQSWNTVKDLMWDGEVLIAGVLYQAFLDAADARKFVLSDPFAAIRPSYRRVFPVAFVPVAGATTLTADAGTYSITGNAATLTRSHIMAAEAGSYSLTGQTAGTAKGYRIAADAGTYVYTGQDASLLRDHVMPAVAGSYAYTGNAATLTDSGGTFDTGWVIAGGGANDAGFGAVAWTNTANITADDGSNASVTLGASPNDTSQYLVSSSHGFSIPSGSAIDGIEVRFQVAASGGLSNFERVRLVKGGTVQTEDKSASPTDSGGGNYDFGGPTDLWGDTWSVSDINDTGFGAALSMDRITNDPIITVDAVWVRVYYSESPNQMVALPGSYVISGQDAGTVWDHILVAAQGSYTLTGNAAGTLWNHVLAATSGSYALTGNASGTLWDHSLAAAQGIYNLTGNDASTLGGLSLTAVAGSYAITGNAAATSRGYVLAALSGAYEITGNAALFDAPIWQNLPINPGETWTDSSGGSTESWYSASPGPGEIWSEEE